MEVLVGHTGFVGGNIAAKHGFDVLCNSKNIAEIFGTKLDLLVYSGVPSEMFLANSNPDADRAVTESAAQNICKINPKRLVLISTIAVLDNPVGVDEDTEINANNLTAYGLNRLNLEKAVVKKIEHCHIIRLPALFGNGIKKNFIYDMINYFPALLNKVKYNELSVKEPVIAHGYVLQDNGFYKLAVADNKRAELKAAFKRVGFSALNFTDSRSAFQFYNLTYLWSHIETVLANNVPLQHMAVEPLTAAQIYEYIFEKPFVNELQKSPFNYDFRTKYSDLFNEVNGYIFKKMDVLESIRQFVITQECL